MAKVRITGNRWIDVSEAAAEKVKSLKGSRTISPSTMIDLGNGVSVALSGIQEINFSNDGIIRERYDIFRDRTFLEQFGTVIAGAAPGSGWRERFRRHSIIMGLIDEAGNVDRQNAPRYHDEQEKFSAFMKLEDWKNNVADERERSMFGDDLIPTGLSTTAREQVMIGLQKFLDGNPGASRAFDIAKKLSA